MSCNNNSADIAAIDAVLNAGVVQSSMDGQTVTFDLKQLEKRKRELQNNCLTAQVNGTVRPVMMRANYSRFLA